MTSTCEDNPTIEIMPDGEWGGVPFLGVGYCIYQFSRGGDSAYLTDTADTLPEAIRKARWRIAEADRHHDLVVRDGARLAAWDVIDGGRK